jgi:hypothetical protein
METDGDTLVFHSARPRCPRLPTRNAVSARWLARHRTVAAAALLWVLGCVGAVAEDAWRSLRLSAPPGIGFPQLRFLSGFAVSPDDLRAVAIVGNEADGYGACVSRIGSARESDCFPLPLVSSASDAVWGQEYLAIAGQTNPHEVRSSVLVFPARLLGLAKNRQGRLPEPEIDAPEVAVRTLSASALHSPQEAGGWRPLPFQRAAPSPRRSVARST